MVLSSGNARCTVPKTVVRTNRERVSSGSVLVPSRREGRVRIEEDVQRETDAAERFSERVQRDWRRAFVRALTEPATNQEDGERQVPSTPVEQLAARAVSVVWPHVENLARPIFETTTEVHIRADTPSEPATPSASVSGVRPAAWLSAEEVAPVLHMTAHTLRRLARNGQSPVVVRRIGGRWCFSRSGLERLVETTR